MVVSYNEQVHMKEINMILAYLQDTHLPIIL